MLAPREDTGTASKKISVAGMLEPAVAVEPKTTAVAALEKLVTSGHGENFVCLTDADNRFLGIVTLAALGQGNSTRKLSELYERDQAHPLAVQATMRQELVALFALRHNISAVPVIDSDRRLVGIVPPIALLEIMHEEHVEDLHRLSGILRESRRAKTALEASPLRRARARLPWLLVGLAGSVIATATVSSFESALEEKLVLAFFIPGIVYLADAIGTQTEAVAVRALSHHQPPLRRAFRGELGTGLLIGALLGALIFPAIWIVFRDIRLALSVSLTVLTAGTLATALGLGFPWLLSTLGKDPAFGSGPLATVVQDVFSLIIYFVIASWLM